MSKVPWIQEFGCEKRRTQLRDFRVSTHWEPPGPPASLSMARLASPNLSSSSLCVGPMRAAQASSPPHCLVEV